MSTSHHGHLQHGGTALPSSASASRRFLQRLSRLIPAAAALAAGAVPAQPQGDPLDSADCRRALAALQAQETEAAQAPEAARLRLDVLRRRAAQACLQRRADPPAPLPPPGRLAQPPLAVPPVSLPASAPRPARPRPPAEIPPPIRSAPPVTVMSCDPAGCWTSEGTRLQRVGPELLGPRGFCSRAGAVVQCP